MVPTFVLRITQKYGLAEALVGRKRVQAWPEISMVSTVILISSFIGYVLRWLDECLYVRQQGFANHVRGRMAWDDTCSFLHPLSSLAAQ